MGKLLSIDMWKAFIFELVASEVLSDSHPTEPVHRLMAFVELCGIWQGIGHLLGNMVMEHAPQTTSLASQTPLMQEHTPRQVPRP
jgi:hypothetical protein